MLASIISLIMQENLLVSTCQARQSHAQIFHIHVKLDDLSTNMSTFQNGPSHAQVLEKLEHPRQNFFRTCETGASQAYILSYT